MLKHTRVSPLLFVFGVLIFGLVASSAPEPIATPAAVLPTETPIPPTPTATPILPTETPDPRTLEAEDVDADFLVTFDGEECIVSGPQSVPVGDYRIVWINLTEDFKGLYLGHLRDGHTYQDLLDLQSEPGESYPKPNWLISPIRAMAWDAANERYVYTYSLDWEGEHSIHIQADIPPILWFCRALEVTEASE